MNKIGYHFKLEKEVMDYLVNKEIPLRVIYSNGDSEEGLILQGFDNYNYLLFNPNNKITSFVLKGNVRKIDVMVKVGNAIKPIPSKSKK